MERQAPPIQALRENMSKITWIFHTVSTGNAVGCSASATEGNTSHLLRESASEEARREWWRRCAHIELYLKLLGRSGHQGRAANVGGCTQPARAALHHTEHCNWFFYVAVDVILTLSLVVTGCHNRLHFFEPFDCPTSLF